METHQMIEYVFNPTHEFKPKKERKRKLNKEELLIIMSS